MALSLKLQHKLSQQLVMTQQLQHAVKLLQLSYLDVTHLLREEIQQNPLLEEVEHADTIPYTTHHPSKNQHPSAEAIVATTTSLTEYLLWQVTMGDLNVKDSHIAHMLIDALNDDGYLPSDIVETTAHELHIPVSDVAYVLQCIQQFDPAGVAARSLEECLLIQIRQMVQDKPMLVEIIKHHMQHIERRQYNIIAKSMHVSVHDIMAAIKCITTLQPHPGRIFADKQIHYIIPDVYVSKVGSDYIVSINDDHIPKVQISRYYQHLVKKTDSITKSYLLDKMRAANWLLRSIHMRQRTICRVMESILKFQRDFFDHGMGHFKPLILKDVAQDLGMHESTISRATTNKYTHTPQGIYELKFFFNSSIARTYNQIQHESLGSVSVCHMIKQIIAQENHARPYSDQQLVHLLKAKNIDIARRTVAKFRTKLKIETSSRRRRCKPDDPKNV